MSTRQRIVVAMSGGVDSTVTAALLTQAGYDVVGVTLQLYDHGAAIQKKGPAVRAKTFMMRVRRPSGSASRTMSSTMRAAFAKR